MVRKRKYTEIRAFNDIICKYQYQKEAILFAFHVLGKKGIAIYIINALNQQEMATVVLISSFAMHIWKCVAIH